MNFKLVEHNSKLYQVGFTTHKSKSGFEQIVPFVIDNDDYDKIISFDRKINYNSVNGYMCMNASINKKRHEFYLHNIIMNHTPQGKGSKISVDHINRIKTDNRKENLRIITQSGQNINRNKLKKRLTNLPENCGINPDDVPKNILYTPPRGNHGEHFCVSIDGINKKTSKSNIYTIHQKLNQAIDILNNIVLNDADRQRTIHGNLTEQGDNNEKSYYNILDLVGYHNYSIHNLSDNISQISEQGKNYFLIENHPDETIEFWKSSDSTDKTIYDKYIETMDELNKYNNIFDKDNIATHIKHEDI